MVDGNNYFNIMKYHLLCFFRISSLVIEKYQEFIFLYLHFMFIHIFSSGYSKTFVILYLFGQLNYKKYFFPETFVDFLEQKEGMNECRKIFSRKC